ncbi:MAG: DUF460 domain-containing protein [Candidatus Woesearchaeota archaeon]
MNMQPIIVGIDPGTTSAFAVLSFDFKVLKVKSKKSYSLAGIIYDVYKEGYPLIIATDKKEIPSFIKEFSQKTGSKIYNPKYDTKKGEKLYIVKEKGFLDFCKNTHEIDALASALYAYREYYSLIKKIDNYVKDENKSYLKNILLTKVIIEEKNILKAISEIESKNEEKPKKEIRKIEQIFLKDLTKEEKEIFLLKKTIDKLKNELNFLKKENNLLKEKRIDINSEIKKIISFKERRALFLAKENNFLRNKINQKNIKLKELNEIILKTKNSVLIKKLKNLSSKEYQFKKDLLKIEKNDILFIENFDSFSEKVLYDLKEITNILVFNFINQSNQDKKIIKDLEKHFLIIDKNIFNMNNLIYENENFLLLSIDEFENLKNKLMKEKNKKDLLNEIIENYKYERKKELFDL